jgi:hypothetical protein
MESHVVDERSVVVHGRDIAQKSGIHVSVQPEAGEGQVAHVGFEAALERRIPNLAMMRGLWYTVPRSTW